MENTTKLTPNLLKKFNWKRTNCYSLIYIIIIFFHIISSNLWGNSTKRFQLLAGKASHNLSLESKEGVGGWAEELGESNFFFYGGEGRGDQSSPTKYAGRTIQLNAN